MSSLRRLRALSAHLGGPGAAPPSTPGNTKAVATVGSGMVIATVEALHVLRSGGTCLVFVKIVTDSGVVGWGEATNSGREQPIPSLPPRPSRSCTPPHPTPILSEREGLPTRC